jgi:hypothetical protein
MELSTSHALQDPRALVYCDDEKKQSRLFLCVPLSKLTVMVQKNRIRPRMPIEARCFENDPLAYTYQMCTFLNSFHSTDS